VTATTAPSTFRPLQRAEHPRFIKLVSHALARVMLFAGLEEAARNVVQPLVDGECAKVYQLVLDVLRSPTRARVLSSTDPRQHALAAAEVAVDYVDAVCPAWPSQLHRWSVLTQVVGIPEDVLRALELERRAARGDVAA
jgi:hypothetical protein